MEIWTGYSQDYGNLRVFGCAAYAHHRDDKLGVRALKCVFLGYPEGTKGYKLWCIESGGERLITTRHVVFNEDSFPWAKKVTHCCDEEDKDLSQDLKFEDGEGVPSIDDKSTLTRGSNSQIDPS